MQAQKMLNQNSIFLIENEETLIDFLSDFMILSAVIVFVTFTFLGFYACYGRYRPDSLFPKFVIPAPVAWLVQELPSFLIPLYPLWKIGLSNLPCSNLIALAMFVCHYFQRSLIYPLLIREGKPTPIHLFLLGFVFCSWNGYIQGFYHAKYAKYPSNHFSTFSTILGIFLFLTGMFINLQADHILRNLRRTGEKGYKIPFGGMFEYVSGANFFGEILEWTGYALFAQTKAAFAFALFTAANTIPRAKKHHSWYLQKFKNYPSNRKAVIPFLY